MSPTDEPKNIYKKEKVRLNLEYACKASLPGMAFCQRHGPMEFTPLVHVLVCMLWNPPFLIELLLDVGKLVASFVRELSCQGTECSYQYGG